MARKLGQIIARRANTWLVRVYLGRDSQPGTRKYYNQTVHGPFREAQRSLNLKLQQRENGRVSRVASMSLNQLLDQWLTTVVKRESGQEHYDPGPVAGTKAQLLGGRHKRVRETGAPSSTVRSIPRALSKWQRTSARKSDRGARFSTM
jgi:hypothetical protein